MVGGDMHCNMRGVTTMSRVTIPESARARILRDDIFSDAEDLAGPRGPIVAVAVLDWLAAAREQNPAIITELLTSKGWR